MNQKELSEIRRRWRPEKNAVSRIYGCYVNTNREIITDLDESLGLLTQEEVEKYLGFLKKALSGTLGRNLIDIVFTTQQVQDSEEHRLLSDLRNSGLKDGEARRKFYDKVIQSLDMGESNYLILLAHDTYDVPHKGKDDSMQDDASDRVYSYFLCAICPMKDGKVELGFFPGENEFHTSMARQIVCPPETGFLFPTFDDRRANLYNAIFYTHKPDAIHQELIDTLFHVEPPMSPAEQREGFETALSEAVETGCSMELMQAVHEQLCARIVAHKESKDPEAPAVSLRELKAILTDCGLTQEQLQRFESVCGESFGGQTYLNPMNLIDAGRFQIKTEQATVSVDPAYSHMVETRTLEGRNYILLPVGDGVELNGMAVGIEREEQ